MSSAPTIAQLREHLGSRGGNAKCPAHDDEHGSLSISEGQAGKPLFKCHAGCSQSAVVAALQERGIWPRPTGLTVAELAAAKQLPESLLRESGFSDEEHNGRSVIRMDYRSADGEILCVRYRGALAANGSDRRFWFRRGDKQQLFGLWRLKPEPVILVEGETDSLALWAAGFNAIGVPGAEAWREKRFVSKLAKCQTIYVHVEPDGGGEKFRAAFMRSKLRDRVRFFTIAPDAKDPCDLRARDPDQFRTAIEALLAKAHLPVSTHPAVPTEQTGDATALPAGVSDDALALRFTERYGQMLRYVAAWDRWLIWDGRRWAHDERRQVWHLARTLCRDVLLEQLSVPLTESQDRTLRNRLGSTQTVYAVVRLAGSDPQHALSVNELDADPWRLNTPGGILDLRTGELRPSDPGALCTKVTAATPGGECPIFLRTLERVQPDRDVRAYIQRLAGYGMTGSSREHVLPFWHGTGRNGKGTIAHAMRRALGDYGLEIPPEILMESHNDRHPTELADLHGARLVVASEIDSGRRWNESRVKRLTGGDPIRARYMAKDFFEFEPSHTLIVFANAKPGLRSVDEAIRARMNMIEWAVRIPEGECDTTLPERLAAEYGGILAWMLEGCLDWQAGALKPPQAVQAATSAYLAAEDMLQAWIEECCERRGQITLSAAHRSYREWCERSGGVVLGRNSFGDQLEAHGFSRGKESHSGKPVFGGLSLPIPADPGYPE